LRNRRNNKSTVANCLTHLGAAGYCNLVEGEFPQHTCEPLGFKPVTVENSNTESYSQGPANTHVVLRDAGYGQNGEWAAASFSIPCVGTAVCESQWLNIKNCDPVPCPELTIANSDTTSDSNLAVTLEAYTVECIDGYEFADGQCTRSLDFTVEAPGTSTWTFLGGDNLDACQPMECALPVLSNVDPLTGPYYTGD
jgi:predicted metal-binding protein